jgi:SWI/SNF-related matrix-associated actin-dependent regulator 1 of chromatin subfamily A
MATRTELRQALGSLYDVVDEHLQGEKLPVVKGMTALSTAHDAPEYDGPLADVLFPFQKAGVTFVRKVRRALLGHDMGLGKTIQAVAVAASERLFPLVVVCPPSLSLNWVKEFAKWTPDVSVHRITGRTVTELPQADVYVIGDAVVSYWAEALIDLDPAMLVVDECQRMKNYKANRTQAVKRIARFVKSDGIRMGLSGTPVKNDNPSELIPQMEILNVLDGVFGSTENYLDNYYPKVDRYDREACNLADLHAKISDSFYARLTMTEAAYQMGENAPKGVIRLPIAVEMAGKAATEYQRARDDLRSFLTEKNGKARADKAMRAEALVMLNTLRRLSGLAKIENTTQYVKDLVEDGNQVIVFALHRDVTTTLAKAFNAPTIIGGQSQESVEKGKDAFQKGEAKVIVLNIEAGGVGHTLTAATHVVFAEFGWTPADMTQAEARANRIGQTEIVRSHWLFGTNGAETIDERLVSILNVKAEVTGAILDGEGAAMIDSSTLDSLLDWAENG